MKLFGDSYVYWFSLDFMVRRVGFWGFNIVGCFRIIRFFILFAFIYWGCVGRCVVVWSFDRGFSRRGFSLNMFLLKKWFVILVVIVEVEGYSLLSWRKFFDIWSYFITFLFSGGVLEFGFFCLFFIRRIGIFIEEFVSGI